MSDIACRITTLISICVAATIFVSGAENQSATRVVMLGTGTPIPNINRAGPSIAIVHKNTAYLFDVGAGAVQNANRASAKYDISSLKPTRICCVFLTHLHSDHTLDFVELNYTRWWTRKKNLLAYGPIGLEEMSNGMLAMMAPDVRIRTSGNQPVNAPKAYRPIVSEISEGIVLNRNGIKIEAFPVSHGDVKPAFAYRVTTQSLTVVISGDTAYSEKLREMATGVDILIHEFISSDGLLTNSKEFQNYHRRSHTTATELGRLASAARPKLLVLYHGLHYGVPEENSLAELKMEYDGEVIMANDLDIFPKQ